MSDVQPELPRLKGLDALRGLAAILVVIDHFSKAAIGRWIPSGSIGVALFFVISGFVMLQTVERAPTRLAFVLGRVTRLYPTFIAACLLTTLTTHLLRVSVFQIPPREVLANLTMVPQLFGARFVEDCYWTLGYEAGFYAICVASWPLIKSGRMEYMAAVWLLSEVLSPGRWREQHLLGIYVTCYGDLFVAGMCLSRLRRQRSSRTSLILAAAFCINPWCILYAGMVWLAAKWQSVPRPIKWLGDISYPLYLNHKYNGLMVIALLTAVGTPPALAGCASLAIMMLLADFLHRRLERPAQHWLNARLIKGERPLEAREVE